MRASLLHRVYANRLRRQRSRGRLPDHVGLIIDGNRRWAVQHGATSATVGHRYGAEHVHDLLRWNEALEVKHVTVFVCSDENLQRRDRQEVDGLLQLVESCVAERLADPDARWRVHVVGALDVLPAQTAHALKRAVEVTRGCTSGAHLTLAIGYGGRQEVVEAVRQLLYDKGAQGCTAGELVVSVTVEDIAARLESDGSPDPDLIIRTSGELRLSNFLLWQSVSSELYFADALWPAFREVDYLRALRTYAERRRRGSR